MQVHCISIDNYKFISVFCKDFLDSLFKMEKRGQELQYVRLYSKKNFFRKKNEHFENILLLNVLPMHHQSVSGHTLDSVEHL